MSPEKEHSNNHEEEDDEQEEEEEQGEALPACVLARIDRLKELEEERRTELSRYRNERAALEAKYNQSYSKLYQERAAIVQGSRKDVDTTTSSGTEEDAVTGIPQFWIQVMSHQEDVAATISEQDVDCLAFLRNIECIDDEDGKGFTLKFQFAPNPFFENDVLTKRYQVPNLLSSGNNSEPILQNVQGTNITWKHADLCLTHQTTTKKQKGKGQHAGQLRTVLKQERVESFFHWFDPPTMPSLEDMTEETAANLEVAFDMDYEVAQAFRTIVVPQAVLLYTGELLEGAQSELETACDQVLAANNES